MDQPRVQRYKQSRAKEVKKRISARLDRSALNPLQLAIESTTYHVLDLFRHVLNPEVKFRNSNRNILFRRLKARRLGRLCRISARLGWVGFTGEDCIRVFIRVEVKRGEGGVV